jgi:hypothetical protein
MIEVSFKSKSPEASAPSKQQRQINGSLKILIAHGNGKKKKSSVKNEWRLISTSLHMGDNPDGKIFQFDWFIIYHERSHRDSAKCPSRIVHENVLSNQAFNLEALV